MEKAENIPLSAKTGTPRATTFLVENDPPPDIPMLLDRIEALEREVARIPQLEAENARLKA